MATLPFTVLSRDVPVPSAWTAPAVSQRPGPGPRRFALLAFVQEAWRRRRSRNYLAQFDDHMLKDIGLTRSEADFEANKPFWQA
jgi:uncharacterized protein YjiS (DUF1127 family)